MPGFPKSRPPANRVALERWINQKAQDDGVAANRLRRAVSFMVLSAVLARFVDEQSAPLFLLKGGVAMELRVGVRARASKDAAQIQAARKQLQAVWAGLQPDRVAAVTKIKPLLTPDQLTVLEDAKNQWHENQADEASDPSAN